MRRILAVTVLAGLAFAGLATPAFAHNGLIDSNPKNGVSVEQGPGQIELTFDQPVQDGNRFNAIAVVGPGDGHWESGAATVSGNRVHAPVRPLGPAGEYRIGWRVLSADGHPVSGELKFTLTKAGTGTPTPPEQVAEFSGGQAEADDATGDEGIPAWVWIVGAVILLGLGVFLALRIGGREEDGKQ